MPPVNSGPSAWAAGMQNKRALAMSVNRVIIELSLKQAMKRMQLEKLKIEKATLDCTKVLEEFARQIRHNAPDEYFLQQYEIQEQGHREVLIGRSEGAVVGYVVLNWRPKYAFFRKSGIPEVQDLIVHPDYRRMGIAKALIAYCEDRARAMKFEYMGLGVGLDSSYGAAQVLYAGLGYAPDGNGVTYDRSPVMKGEMRPIDDDLSLMLVKKL